MVLRNQAHSSHLSIPSKLPLACVLALLLIGNTARAKGMEDATPSLSFRGFGTVGVAHSSEDKADFLAHDLQGTGAGASRSWSPDVDSRLGAQLSARITSRLSGVLQVITEQRHDATYRPAIEWANLKYEFAPDISIRFGRVLLPSFLVSDSRKVGYAQPWVRPPVEVYSLIPISNSDGVDLSYRMRLGDATNTVQFAYGEANADIPDGGKVKAKDAWLLSDTLEYGDATFHFAYSKSKFSLDAYTQLFDGYREFAQGAALLPFGSGSQAVSEAMALAKKYDPHNKTLSFLSFGASYDPGNWFAMAEWGQTDSDSIFGKRAAWYATAGYRWGSFTPYLTYAETKLKSNQSDPGIRSLPGFAPPELQGGARELNTVLNEQLAGAAIQKTVSLGVRWDFVRNAALKLQYDHSDIGRGSPGTLDHLQDGFKPGGKFEVFSATIDFVF